MLIEKVNSSDLHKCLKQSIDTHVLGSQENVPASNTQVFADEVTALKRNVVEKLWFAMSATFGREMKAKEFLEKNNVRCFVPLRYQLVKVRGKEKVRKLVPAISNLIFVHSTKGRIQALKSDLPYLQYHTMPKEGRNVPVTVPKEQMEQFMAVCNTYNENMIFHTPDELNLTEGTRVKIAGGTFDGVEGTFVRVEKGKHKHVVVLIEGIAAVVLAKVTDGYIQVLD